jgi:hypothetical protein
VGLLGTTNATTAITASVATNEAPKATAGLWRVQSKYRLAAGMTSEPFAWYVTRFAGVRIAEIRSNSNCGSGSSFRSGTLRKSIGSLNDYHPSVPFHKNSASSRQKGFDGSGAASHLFCYLRSCETIDMVHYQRDPLIGRQCLDRDPYAILVVRPL